MKSKIGEFFDRHEGFGLLLVLSVSGALGLLLEWGFEVEWVRRSLDWLTPNLSKFGWFVVAVVGTLCIQWVMRAQLKQSRLRYPKHHMTRDAEPADGQMWQTPNGVCRIDRADPLICFSWPNPDGTKTVMQEDPIEWRRRVYHHRMFLVHNGKNRLTAEELTRNWTRRIRSKHEPARPPGDVDWT